MNGLTATRLVSAELPTVKVVVLTASEDDDDLFDAVASGAQGYLLKNVEPDGFFALLDAVAQGEPAFTPGLARKVLRAFVHPATAEQTPEALTPREQEVLELLVQGATSNRELAARLVVSENTVKYHLRNILGKLHLRNRAQVVAYALRHRMVDRPGVSE
jgi:DNA-binding NarL/FixJ family response regulator